MLANTTVTAPKANAHDSAWNGANLTRHSFGKTEGQPITRGQVFSRDYPHQITIKGQ